MRTKPSSSNLEPLPSVTPEFRSHYTLTQSLHRGRKRRHSCFYPTWRHFGGQQDVLWQENVFRSSHICRRFYTTNWPISNLEITLLLQVKNFTMNEDSSSYKKPFKFNGSSTTINVTEILFAFGTGNKRDIVHGGRVGLYWEGPCVSSPFLDVSLIGNRNKM